MMKIDHFNNLATSWDADYAENDRVKLAKMVAHFEIAPGASVIDIGCGTGILVPFLLEKIGIRGHLTCLDFACEMLNVARKKNLKANIDYVCADISDTGIPDAFFDVAICYSSFPHFQAKLKALREINRILKPEGELFVCHTSSRCEINEMHSHIPVLKNDTIPDEIEMKNMLCLAGFSNVTVNDGRESYVATAKKATTELL